MSYYRITRHYVHPSFGDVDRSVELIGYVDADDRRAALRLAREEFGSERDIGTIRATAVRNPDEDEAAWQDAVRTKYSRRQ